MNVELIGCGGSAHHIITPLAQLLALNGTNRLRLWDGDTFEERNTSRQFLALGRLGQNKADAMGEYISSIVPSLNISAEDVYFYFDLAREELGSKPIIICLADNNKARQQAMLTVNNLGGLLISSGSNGWQGEGWVYNSDIRNLDCDPFKVWPDMLTDDSNDPRHPASCQSTENLEANPQTPFENYMSASIALQLFCNWCIRPCENWKNNIGQITWVRNKIASQTINQLEVSRV